MENEDLSSRFESRVPSETAQQGIVTLRGEFGLIIQLVDDVVPDGREKSLAFTKLEEAAMWAIKGASRG